VFFRSCDALCNDFATLLSQILCAARINAIQANTSSCTSSVECKVLSEGNQLLARLIFTLDKETGPQLQSLDYDALLLPDYHRVLVIDDDDFTVLSGARADS